MTTVQLTGDGGAVIFGAESLLVQVKRRWADDWQTMPYLTPLAAQLSISPDMPRADFMYHYGQIKREDNAEFVDFDPLNLSNWYVRVLIDDQQVFVGILMDDRFDLLGALNNQPSGDQAMTAYGLEHLLDRASVLGAVTLSGTISHTPTFNLVENYGGAVRGNRSDSLVDGVYLFANNDARWSNLDIIRYVLAHHTDFGFEIDLSGQFDVLADIYGAYWFEGLTVRQVLDKLIDRRRGLGWYVWSDGSTVSIHVFTVFERDIGLGDVQIPGNPQQVEINADTLDVQEVTISQSESQLYDRIVVQGARARTVFTLSLQEGSLNAAWSASDEAAYKSVAGVTNKERDAERESDRFAPVYQHFTLSDNWNETANDGMGGDRLPVLPAFNDLAQLQSGSSPAMQIRRPFNRTLPFYDENGDPVAPIVIGLASTENSDRYVQLDGSGKVLGQAKSLVRMMDEKPGIVLRAGINHALARNHFDNEVSGSDTTPVVDYKTLLSTVSIETDTRPSVDVMLNADTDNARVLVLTVHDAEFWYVTPDTVRGVENGQLQRESGGAVRDDTDKLRYLAALATGWYGQKRSSITLTTRNLPSNLSLGSLVTSAASSWHKENIGTVLSSIDYDFVGRTTTIRTGYAELDLQAMLDIPGMSDFRSVGRAFNRQQAQIKQMTDRMANLPVRYAASASIDETDSETAAVDFIVDNFDRANNDSLGTYWDSTAINKFLIRSGCMVTNTEVTGARNRKPYYFFQVGAGAGVTGGSVYNQDLGGNTVNASLTTNAPISSTYQSSDTHDGEYSTTASAGVSLFGNILLPEKYSDANAISYLRTVKAENYKVSVTLELPENYDRLDYIRGLSLGLFLSGAKDKNDLIISEKFNFSMGNYTGFTVSASTSGSSVSFSSADSGLAMIMDKQTLSDQAGSQNIIDILTQERSDTDRVEIGQETVESSSYSIEYPVNGFNYNKNPVLTFHVKAGEVDIYLDNVQIKQTSIDKMTPGGFLGFTAMDNMLQKFQNGVLIGVTQIKVWTDNIPEPPGSQSGHGYYDNENSKFLYTDGYHVPDGNGGIVYDPTALD